MTPKLPMNINFPLTEFYRQQFSIFEINRSILYTMLRNEAKLILEISKAFNEYFVILANIRRLWILYLY